jgi:hypothetical protein
MAAYVMDSGHITPDSACDSNNSARTICDRRSISCSELSIASRYCSVLDAVNKAKPTGAKGHYINRIAISSTMGPGVMIDQGTLG